MTIPADIITCAKAAKIETVLEHRGIKLHGKTTNRCGACPRCGGDDRFGINIKKQLWYCRGCGVGGDVIALVQFLDDCIFAEAIERLTNHRPQSEPKPTPVSETAEDYEAAQHRKAAMDARPPRPRSAARGMADRVLARLAHGSEVLFDTQ